MISAPVQADKTGAAIAALQDDLKHFLTDQGITQDEFDRTIAGATRQLAGSFETANAVLGAMQTNDLLRRPDDYYADARRPTRPLHPSRARRRRAARDRSVEAGLDRRRRCGQGAAAA